MNKVQHAIILLCLAFAFAGNSSLKASINLPEGMPGSDTLCQWRQMGIASTPTYILTGKPEGSGRIDRIVFQPGDSNICYVASPGGGLWKITQYSETWLPLTDALPVTGVADIAISNKDHNKIWIATGDAFTDWSFSDGLYYSINGGSDWVPSTFHFAPSDTGKRIFRISLNPENDRSVFVGTSSGLFHSSDNGNSFRKAAIGAVQDMEWLSGDSSLFIFTLKSQDDRTFICRSRDAGLTYDTVFIPTDPVTRIELSAAQGIGYAILIKSSGNLYGVYRSENNGDGWTKTSGSSPDILGWTCEGTGQGAGTNIISLAVNPWNTNEVYAGSNYLWKSKDGGKTWNAISGWCGGDIPYVRPYHRALTFGPDKKIYTGSGGGIFRSPDEGKTWVNISNNLFIMPVTFISAPSGMDFLVAGTLENGSLKVNGGNWNFIYDGDGLSPLVYDSLNFFIQARDALTENIKLLKTSDGGMTYRVCTPSGKSGNIYSPLITYPGQDNILFFSYGPLFRSTDCGLTWEIIASTDEPFRFLLQSALKPKVLYGAGNQKVFRSSNGGYEWKEILSGLKDNISAIKLSSSNPNLLWVAFSTWEDHGRVLQTDDGGISWEDISQGLPVCPVFSLEYDPQRQLLLAGTQQGVFVRNQGGDWKIYGTDLPHCRVTSLQLDTERELVFAGTMGRGVWEAPLITAGNQPTPDFEVSSTTSCGGSHIFFTGKAWGKVNSWHWNFGEGAYPMEATGQGPHEVSYPEPGFYTIQLTINDSIAIVKKDLVEAVASIKVEVLADEICTVDTLQIMAFGADHYEWSPATGMISDYGNGSVLAYPNGRVTYVVKGIMGNCSALDTVIVITIPDDIDQAFPLVQGTNGPFSNKCATSLSSDPVIPTGSVGDGCNSQDGWCRKRSLTNTIWFSLLVPESGIVSLEAPGDFNNQMALFLRSPDEGSLILMAANDDYLGIDGNNGAAITGISGLEPGATCMVLIDGGGNGETGEFNLILRDGTLGYTNLPYESIKIYPNPARNLIQISGISRNSAYKIMTIDGKVLRTGIIEISNQEIMAPLNLTGLSGRFFILRIENEDGIWTKKILVE